MKSFTALFHLRRQYLIDFTTRFCSFTYVEIVNRFNIESLSFAKMVKCLFRKSSLRKSLRNILKRILFSTFATHPRLIKSVKSQRLSAHVRFIDAAFSPRRINNSALAEDVLSFTPCETFCALNQLVYLFIHPPARQNICLLLSLLCSPSAEQMIKLTGSVQFTLTAAFVDGKEDFCFIFLLSRATNCSLLFAIFDIFVVPSVFSLSRSEKSASTEALTHADSKRRTFALVMGGARVFMDCRTPCALNVS